MFAGAVNQGADNVTERGQREVNLHGLLQSVTLCIGLTLSFWTGEIDKVQLSNLEHSLTSRPNLRRLNVNRKDRVTTRGIFIHGSLANFSILAAGVK